MECEMARLTGLAILAALLVAAGAARAAEPPEGARVLIAYFSWSGNTKALAEEIQKRTGADIFEIATVKPYPADYNDCIDQAKAEQEAGARPELKARVEDLGRYDVIILGHPNWWGTIPMAVATFLELYDFSGKTIVPFVSHGGGGQGRSLGDVERSAKGARVLAPLVVRGKDGRSLGRDMDKWLADSGLAGG
jgi:flavodoxin